MENNNNDSDGDNHSDDDGESHEDDYSEGDDDGVNDSNNTFFWARKMDHQGKIFVQKLNDQCLDM